MDGKNHKIFAPIFTFGVSQLLLQSGVLSSEIGQTGVVVATMASLLTSTLPDADLFAGYPTMAITDAMPSRKRNGYYHFKGPDGRVRKYRPPKSKVTRATALFMKSIGVRKHRDWRTHAPTIFFPLGFLIIKLTNSIQLSGEFGKFTALLQSIIVGLVLGYVSHIVADIPNKGGVPLGPSNKQYSITRKIFGNKLSNFFKSGNKIYSSLFIALSIDAVFFIINKDLALRFNLQIFAIIKMIFKPLIIFIKTIFNRLLG